MVASQFLKDSRFVSGHGFTAVPQLTPPTMPPSGSAALNALQISHSELPYHRY
jgi:hypothetical protein